MNCEWISLCNVGFCPGNPILSLLVGHIVCLLWCDVFQSTLGCSYLPSDCSNCFVIIALFTVFLTFLVLCFLCSVWFTISLGCHNIKKKMPHFRLLKIKTKPNSGVPRDLVHFPVNFIRDLALHVICIFLFTSQSGAHFAS